MKPPITSLKSVMLTSGKISMPTLSCLGVLPCTLVLLIVCKRKSLPWLHLPSKSRSLLLLKGNTLSGSVVPSWLHFLPSNRCGSPSKNTMNAVLLLSTENASKHENIPKTMLNMLYSCTSIFYHNTFRFICHINGHEFKIDFCLLSCLLRKQI